MLLRVDPVISVDQLPATPTARLFEGAEHGGVAVSIFLVDAPPAAGPALHVHPYDEVFVVQQGEATFMLAGETLVVRAGELVIAPAGVAHRFENTGAERLRLTSVSPSARASTEWLAADH